ncbi:hypothetical protein [Clostridium guangxiense]|nr:hypothetical protein [Clostridium guangxiense]MCD2348978.1 hypothetical protein [Clostridium guangxiense]
MAEKIISISMPPFPDFIEGNYITFQKGQLHPNRCNLGYFDMLFIKSGTLYLEEEGDKYEVGANKMLILLLYKVQRVMMQLVFGKQKNCFCVSCSLLKIKEPIRAARQVSQKKCCFILKIISIKR